MCWVIFRRPRETKRENTMSSRRKAQLRCADWSNLYYIHVWVYRVASVDGLSAARILCPPCTHNINSMYTHIYTRRRRNSICSCKRSKRDEKTLQCCAAQRRREREPHRAVSEKGRWRSEEETSCVVLLLQKATADPPPPPPPPRAVRYTSCPLCVTILWTRNILCYYIYYIHILWPDEEMRAEETGYSLRAGTAHVAYTTHISGTEGKKIVLRIPEHAHLLPKIRTVNNGEKKKIRLTRDTSPKTDRATHDCARFTFLHIIITRKNATRLRSVKRICMLVSF